MSIHQPLNEIRFKVRLKRFVKDQPLLQPSCPCSGIQQHDLAMPDPADREQIRFEWFCSRLRHRVQWWKSCFVSVAVDSPLSLVRWERSPAKRTGYDGSKHNTSFYLRCSCCGSIWPSAVGSQRCTQAPSLCQSCLPTREQCSSELHNTSSSDTFFDVPFHCVTSVTGHLDYTIHGYCVSVFDQFRLLHHQILPTSLNWAKTISYGCGIGKCTYASSSYSFFGVTKVEDVKTIVGWVTSG